MSETTPTRAAVLELKDEQRAMHEGYVFLDEKCLLLAGEMLRQLARHAELESQLQAAHEAAMAALQAALARAWAARPASAARGRSGRFPRGARVALADGGAAAGGRLVGRRGTAGASGARALQDVLLPELGRSIRGIETRLEELEQEEAVLMRRRA